MTPQNPDNDKSESSQPSSNVLVNKPRLSLPKIPPELAREIDDKLTTLSHRINAIMRRCFDRYTKISGTRNLLFPGAEFQVIYNCQNMESTREEEDRLAYWMEEVLTAEFKAMQYEVVVKSILFPGYTQFIINLFRYELYEKINTMLYKDAGPDHLKP